MLAEQLPLGTPIRLTLNPHDIASHSDFGEHALVKSPVVITLTFEVNVGIPPFWLFQRRPLAELIDLPTPDVDAYLAPGVAGR
jgi:hypothetical protein